MTNHTFDYIQYLSEIDFQMMILNENISFAEPLKDFHGTPVEKHCSNLFLDKNTIS
jgi:hypothetical protein